MRLILRCSVLKAYGGDERIETDFSMFKPIDALQRQDADVMLFFLSSQGITFTQPVDDLWYSAHKPGPARLNSVSGLTEPMYLSDELVTVLGCTWQWQFCNPFGPEETRCNPLRGMADDRFDRYDIWQSASQKTTMEWVYNAIGLGIFSISGIVDALGVSALKARNMLEDALQAPLPPDQWQREVELWVAASLASIQGSLVEAASGPSSSNMVPFRVIPNTTEEWNVCNNQVSILFHYHGMSSSLADMFL
jgi:hypothetical protein